MNEEQIQKATIAIENERKKISIEFAQNTAKNQENKKKDKPYISCWPLGLEYSRRCAIAALKSLERK